MLALKATAASPPFFSKMAPSKRTHVGANATSYLLGRPSSCTDAGMAKGFLKLRRKISRMFRRSYRRGIFAALLAEERLTRLTTYRQRRREYWPIYVWVAAATVFFIVMTAPSLKEVLTSLATPDGKIAYEFWLGSKSVYDLIIGLMTTVIAIIAAFLALRSYRVNQRAAVANRYQKGIELLGAAADSSKLGGIELLSVVAREDYREYQEPVLRTLRQFLLERCAAPTEMVYKKGRTFDPATLPATDFVVMAALSAVARTNWRRRWLELEHDNEGLALRGIHLHQVRLVNYDLSRIRFEEAVLGDVIFDACTFAETFIEARCFGVLKFHNCLIDNSGIAATDINETRLDDDALIRMSRNRRVSKFRVNGRLIQPSR
ncbi:hypothetical protein V6767_16335 [Martelella sp. FLE1502]